MDHEFNSEPPVFKEDDEDSRLPLCHPVSRRKQLTTLRWKCITSISECNSVTLLAVLDAEDGGSVVSSKHQ